MEARETPRIHKYGESKTTRIMVASVSHVTSGSGLRKFQATWFMLHRVYQYLQKYFPVNPLCLEKRWTLLILWEFPSYKAACRFTVFSNIPPSFLSVFSCYKENWNCQHTHSFTSVIHSEPWDLNSRWLGSVRSQKHFAWILLYHHFFFISQTSFQIFVHHPLQCPFLLLQSWWMQVLFICIVAEN